MNLVLAENRTVSALEEPQKKKTASRHALAITRQEMIAAHKSKMETLLRERRSRCPKRIELKRKIVEQGQKSLENFVKKQMPH